MNGYYSAGIAGGFYYISNKTKYYWSPYDYMGWYRLGEIYESTEVGRRLTDMEVEFYGIMWERAIWND
jgi:hypothetical protein